MAAQANVICLTVSNMENGNYWSPGASLSFIFGYRQADTGRKMLILGHCLRTKHGIRNTYHFISFSKFGTYSVVDSK